MRRKWSTRRALPDPRLSSLPFTDDVVKRFGRARCEATRELRPGCIQQVEIEHRSTEPADAIHTPCPATRLRRLDVLDSSYGNRRGHDVRDQERHGRCCQRPFCAGDCCLSRVRKARSSYRHVALAGEDRIGVFVASGSEIRLVGPCSQQCRATRSLTWVVTSRPARRKRSCLPSSRQIDLVPRPRMTDRLRQLRCPRRVFRSNQSDGPPAGEVGVAPPIKWVKWQIDGGGWPRNFTPSRGCLQLAVARPFVGWEPAEKPTFPTSRPRTPIR